MLREYEEDIEEKNNEHCEQCVGEHIIYFFFVCSHVMTCPLHYCLFVRYPRVHVSIIRRLLLKFLFNK